LPTHRVVKGKPAEPLTGSTRNRYIATIKRLLNLCEAWEWVDRVPKLPRYFEPDVRVRWEPPEVIAALINALRLPWMRDATIVAVATGMRQSELFGLMPSQVGLAQCNAWITHEGAKSKRARSVPLNDDAVGVRRERACQAVGIDDFHWHDLRHTWASWHVQRGTPLMVLKELGGWETIEMVQKYAHLAPSHLAEHAGTVKFWSRLGEQKEKMPLARAA
jgi:integrase